MKFEIKAYNLQELGQRQNQEDSLYPSLGQSTDDDRLFILCDGMGGHEKGEVASATVCEVMSKTILSMWNPSQPLSDEIFQQALAAAYDALDAKDNGEERKMGTTMTFVCLHSEGATIAHIGDSRIYQLRPAKDGNPAKIVFRTQDHSLVNDLVKIGEITEEEAKHHPQKNVITRAMQPCQEYRAKADLAHLTDIQPGDYFYMCSDGMLEEATDENVLNIITKPDATNEQKIEILRGATNENKDNHTAHLIYINKVEGEKFPLVKSELKFSQPKKKQNLFPFIISAVILAIVAIVGSFFLTAEKGEEMKNTENMTKVDATTVRTVKQPNAPRPIVNEQNQVKIKTWQISIDCLLLGDAENEYKIPKEPGFYTRKRWSRCKNDTSGCHAGYHVMGVRCPNILPVKQWVSEIIWKEMKSEIINTDTGYYNINIKKLPINNADISNKDIADYYLGSWKKQYDHYLKQPHECGILEQYGLFVMDVWKYKQYYTMWVYSWYDMNSCGDNTQNSFYTVSTISGKAMSLKDIIDKKDFPKLEKLLAQKIKWLVDKKNFGYHSYEQTWLEQIDGVALVKEGLLVFFHPYKIGCGADGQCNVIFPYSQLKRNHIQIKI